MARQTIAAQFHEYGTAQRARADLMQSGIPAHDVTITAAQPGTTCLTVGIDTVQRERVLRIIRHYAPLEIKDEPLRASAVTLSGAPADRGASPGELPQADSPTESLVREEGRLAADVDPEEEPGGR